MDKKIAVPGGPDFAFMVSFCLTRLGFYWVASQCTWVKLGFFTINTCPWVFMLKSTSETTCWKSESHDRV